MNDVWKRYADRFGALSQRERVMVAAAIVFVVGFLGYSFGLEPLLLKARIAGQNVQRIQAEIPAVQMQLAALKAQNADPDAANRARIVQLGKETASVGERLAGFEAGMVPPEKMQGFLEGLLGRKRGLELLGLKTLPVTQVGEPERGLTAAVGAVVTQATEAVKSAERTLQGTAAAAEPAEGIFQHGVEIRLAGSYNDLLDYLAELERMPQRVMWNSATLSVEKYPRNILTLRIYTLSLDRKWLVL
jgi:MSHA biogenesis protein MshJ